MGAISFEKIIVGLFAFSLVAVAINTSGIYDTSIPAQDLTASEARVTEMTSIEDNPGETYFDSIVGPIKLLGKALSFIVGVGKSVFTLPDLLTAWGIPSYITTMVMGMVFLSFGFWIVAWWTGRRPT